MQLSSLLQKLEDMSHDLRRDVPVVLIVNGVAYPIDQIWWEPNQYSRSVTPGAICLGDDPR